MSKYSLRNILDEELVSKNNACTRVVINALDFFLFPHRFQGMPLKPRVSLEKYEPVVVLTGGESYDDEGVALSETVCFVPSTLKWLSLPMMPYPHYQHSTAVCGGLM